MYIAKQPYKCIKCGFEFMFSPHNDHSAPTNSEGTPSCPKCWDAFLKTIGQGFCTIPFTKDGSEYDQQLESK